MLFLIAGISCMFYVSAVFGPTTSFVIDCLVVVAWGVLCKPVLLLPFDLILGQKTETCLFSRHIIYGRYDFFRNRYYCTWRFYAKNEKIDLIVPASLKRADILSLAEPPKDQILEITYFRFSKILYSWERKNSVEMNTGDSPLCTDKPSNIKCDRTN